MIHLQAMITIRPMVAQVVIVDLILADAIVVVGINQKCFATMMMTKHFV
ncbi:MULTISPECIES: hypothetical protein [Acinetobacter]|jgi:hypothetical protein|nr:MULTISPECIES: hypothetical protein [Acinetobacter]